jgi:hypothetical protein
MLSRIDDAMNLKLIELRERFELLPTGVQTAWVFGILGAVAAIGVWLGAFPKFHLRVPFPK